MDLVATTTPGLEAFAVDEIKSRVGAEATVHHQGAVRFTANPQAIATLNHRARSLNRVLLVVGEACVESLTDIYAATRAVPVERYLAAGKPFAVRGSRHGEHEFTSVDVAERAGQAIVDRTATELDRRLPVDLDDPAYVFRAYVRNDRFVLALDTTGKRSLHRRHWRECEHETPLRPTIAHAMLRAVEYTPSETLLDPMCGSGTIPIEAARWATRSAPGSRRAFAYEALTTPVPPPPSVSASSHPAAIVGTDRQRRWVDCAWANAEAGSVRDAVDFVQADATRLPLHADVVAVDLPFGIRTSTALTPLYDAVSERLNAGSWSRFVAVTTAPDRLSITPRREIQFRYGRLDATLVIAQRD